MDNYVFFDFDGTLTRRDTFFGFLRFLDGRLGMVKILMSELPAILAGLVKGNGGKAKERVLIRALRGMDYAAYIETCRKFGERIKDMEREPIVKALDEAVGNGSEVAIVSASIGDWIRPWAAAHGVKHVIATECSPRPGTPTGTFSTPDCIGPEKVRRILEIWPRLVQPRTGAHVTAYGNSKGDREMLAFADLPVSVGHG